jgi:hypothetical protein
MFVVLAEQSNRNQQTEQPTKKQNHKTDYYIGE